jgi:hypothetical protein
VNDAENALVGTNLPHLPVIKRRESADTEETIDNILTHDGDTEAKYAIADEVIRHLRIASYKVVVSHEYNNSLVDKSAQAYAKIAGRDWTFYVTALKVIIGRPNNKRSSSPSKGIQAGPQVDIDLGPDQQISRLHADITFDDSVQQWCLHVNGRNGGFLDDQRMERGTKAFLRSGHIINILGTQMMFMLPSSPPEIHGVLQKQLLAEDDEDESSTEVREDKPSNPPTSASRSRNLTSNGLSGNTTTANTRTHGISSGRPTPGTPAQKARDAHQPRSKPSPSYHRGVMMETTEEIDYSLENAREIKPPHSYAAMIGQAILSTPEEKATLAKIYDFIKAKYAFFRYGGTGWQNSIRHNLSLSKSFEKVPRRTDEPGKGMKWQIVAEHRDEFMKKNMQPSRRGRNLGSSAPNSPANNLGAVAQTERLMSVLNGDASARKKRTRSITPPSSSYPVAPESYTPDRGPQPSFVTSGALNANAGGSAQGTPPTAGDSLTPTYTRSGHNAQSATSTKRGPSITTQDASRSGPYNSPPTLTNSSYEAHPGSHLFTPLPPRSKPLAAVQSTCKAPSFYAKDLFSSPAPFWKFADLGNTPAQLPDLSPFKPAKEGEDMSSPVVKMGSGEEDETEEDKVQAVGGPHPSSPLPTADAHDEEEHQEEDEEEEEEEEASPTRTVSRPVSRSVANPTPETSVEFGEGVKQEMDEFRPAKGSAAAEQGSRMSGPKSTGGFQMQPMQESTSAVPTYPQPLPAMLSMTGNGALGPRRGFARVEVDDDDDGDIDLAM